MGFAEREAELRAQREKQKRAELRRREALEQQAAIDAQKNALKCSFDFTEQDYESAMHKISEAAWRFDKTMPAAPSLQAFEAQTMEPHIFKEQLKRTLSLQVFPGELGALLSFFSANEKGIISCTDFLNKFIGMGIKARHKQKQEWRAHEIEMTNRRKAREEKKIQEGEMKNAVAVSDYTEADFQSAFSKLSYAAIKYSKFSSGAVGLNAFEAESMAPHIFKEQLKLVFNVKVTNPELAALAAYFDKDEKGVINCKEFVMQFNRTGLEERDRIYAGWREEKRRKREKDAKMLQEKETEKLLRAMREVNYDFTEAEFDSALTKLITMCHQFDFRQLGPAGLKAFQGTSLTPAEFREMARRTFNLKVTPEELGALVTYFDSSMKGVVACAIFLNIFVQLRVKCEGFKGKPDEADRLVRYQAELKEAYKLSIQNAVQDSEDLKLRPWRVGARTSSQMGAVKAKKAPRPTSPSSKLRLRLRVGRKSGRMDLASSATWHYHDVESEGEGEKETGVEVRRPIHVGKILASDDALPPGDLLEFLLHPAQRMSALHSSVERVDFLLTEVPREVFKVEGLTELWLTNNAITAIPQDIKILKSLRILGLSGNRLDRLPDEVCALDRLERVYLQNNLLTSLPDQIENLTSLSELDLARNMFAQVPVGVCELRDLCYLDMSHNTLRTLPSGLAKLTQLMYLNLDGNSGISSPPDVLRKMHWTEVRGCPLPTATSKCAKPFPTREPEDEELEQFLRSRASSRITAKLRRRKKNATQRSGRTSQSASITLEDESP